MRGRARSRGRVGVRVRARVGARVGVGVGDRVGDIVHLPRYSLRAAYFTHYLLTNLLRAWRSSISWANALIPSAGTSKAAVRTK